jgi:hypothetical protein
VACHERPTTTTTIGLHKYQWFRTYFQCTAHQSSIIRCYHNLTCWEHRFEKKNLNLWCTNFSKIWKFTEIIKYQSTRQPTTLVLLVHYTVPHGAHGGLVVWGIALQAAWSRFRLPMCFIGISHWHIPSGRTIALGFDSSSKRNEYQEYFLGAKGGRCQGWQPYHLHGLTVLKSRILKLLEPSGPVQACNGIALPLHRPTLRTSHAPSERDLFRQQRPTNLYLESLSHSFKTKIL